MAIKYKDIKPYLEEIKKILDTKNFKKHIVGKTNCRYWSINLNARANKILKELLISSGFFVYHITNKGFIVSLHQVVAYVHHYYEAMLAGGQYDGTQMHYHHYNGNSLDNRPSNIVLLYEWEHKTITKCQRRAGHFQRWLSPEQEGHTLNLLPLYNKRGKVITNIEDHLQYVLARTMMQTVSWLEHLQRNTLEGPKVKWIVDHVERICKSLIQWKDKSWKALGSLIMPASEVELKQLEFATEVYS